MEPKFIFVFSPPSFSFAIMDDAVLSGDAGKLAELMRQNPGFNVNKAVDEDGHLFALRLRWRQKIRRDSVTPGTS